MMSDGRILHELGGGETFMVAPSLPRRNHAKHPEVSADPIPAGAEPKTVF